MEVSPPRDYKANRGLYSFQNATCPQHQLQLGSHTIDTHTELQGLTAAHVSIQTIPIPGHILLNGNMQNGHNAVSEG